MHPSRPRTPAATRALVYAAAVTLLAAPGLAGVGAGPAAAADGGFPWEVKTAANSFGDHRQNYSYALNPGGQVKDGLVVVNHGATPLNLDVYAADAFTTGAGQLDLAAKDAKPVGVGGWVHAARNGVKVPPGKSAEVPFTVTVPDDAASGDHMGGIVTSLTQRSAADGTKVNRRLGIRIRLRVGGELKPHLSVENPRVRYSGTPNPFGKGDATITYTIRNTGNAILSARQAASAAGPFGLSRVSAGQIDDSPQLLPGETWRVSARVHGVPPALRLTATITLIPLLTDASGSTAPLATVKATTHAWPVPWALLLLLAVLCGLAVVVLVLRRRRSRAKPRQDCPAGES